jgi:Na+-driven multidrug efflux pump
LFSATPDIHLMAASYLCVAGLAYPFLGVGLILSTSFVATGRPFWPLFGITSRVLVVAAGGWIAIHATDTGLVGLAVVTAAGMIVYCAVMAIAFRAGAWRRAAESP